MPPAGVALALTVKRTAPAETDRDPLSRLMLTGARVSERRLSYMAFAGMLMIFLLLPMLLDMLTSSGEASSKRIDIAAAQSPPMLTRFMQTWSPGPISTSHQVFGKQCRACHDTPFVKVRDNACLDCHQALHQHVASTVMTGAGSTQFAQLTCAGCHPDHIGRTTAPRAQQLCATCHNDIKQASAQANSGNVTDFSRDHPPFRLSLRDADRPETIRREREDTPGLSEHSNFKFSHALHLDARGIRAPAGRKVLECSGCHVANDDGVRMTPVSWTKHCQSCHSLSFEPEKTDRQVPHGSVKLVAETLNEFYARMALGAGPDDQQPQAARARPGAVLQYRDRQRVLAIADAQSRRALEELFGKRDICTLCHVVQRVAEEPGWRVAPVRFTQVWMPHAQFSHVAHTSTECTSCHAVTKSQKAEDISMPTLEGCRECHVGPRAVLGKVTSDCATCHRFHAGSDLWRGTVHAKQQTTP